MARAASERFEFRVRPEVKRQIEHAAELVNLPVGDFVRSAAEERAAEVIRASAATVVPADFFASLLAALDAPAQPNRALARASRRARRVVTSR